MPLKFHAVWLPFLLAMPNASSAQGLAPGSAGTDRALATSTKSVHLDRDRPMKLTLNTLVDPVSRGRRKSRSNDSGRDRARTKSM